MNATDAPPGLSRYETLRRERRIARVLVPMIRLGDIITGRVTASFPHLPEHAIQANVSLDLSSDAVCMLYLHESFDPVPEGETVPWIGFGATYTEAP